MNAKFFPLLGVAGSLSCYFAMFPAILLVIIGVFGLSNSAVLSLLNTYLGSVLFQLILILSILFLIAGLLRYGTQPLLFAIPGGIGIFASMNFYMTEWLFTLSFVLVAAAYLFVYRKTKLPQFKFALLLLIGVVVLGAIDLVRLLLPASQLPVPTIPQPQDSNIMDIMNMQ